MNFIINNLLINDPYVLYPEAVVLGLVVGSFLNVVIYRLPKILERQWTRECAEHLGIPPLTIDEKLSLSYPSSHCPKCRHPIRPWENIPLISYIWLKGRCSACTTPISLRYPFTEFICAFLTLSVVINFGLAWQTGAALLLTWGLLTLSLIDYDTQLLPDIITIPLLWLGLLVNSANLFTSSTSAIIGSVIGYMSLWSFYQIFRAITGKEGMGYGDFKLLALFGAWLGWQNLPQIILLSSCTGAAIGIFLILIHRHQRNIPIPFGPYLAIAGWLSLMWGDSINQLYLKWAGLM